MLMTGTLTSMKTYGKSILAFAGAVVMAVYPVLTGDHHVSTQDAIALALSVVSLIGVWLVPLAPQAKWAKTAVAFVLTIGQVAAAGLIGGFNASDVTSLVIAITTFFGVAYAGAVSPTPAGAPDIIAKVGVSDS